MSYEILKHTADLRMRIKGETLERLFEDAVYGMMSFIKTDTKDLNLDVIRELSVKAADRTALLVDFLNEILSLAQINREVYTKIFFKNLSETKVEVELKGVRVETFDEDIKAVTFHEADVEKNTAGEWETNLVFDI